MSKIDEVEVCHESLEEEASVEVVGSDDVEINIEETIEREDEVLSEKLDETDGTLMIQTTTEHISISPGGLHFSHNVKQLVAQFECIPIEYKIQIASRLSLLARQLSTKLSIGFTDRDFTKENISSISPDMEPDNHPDRTFTVILKKLTKCPGKSFKVQLKPGKSKPTLISAQKIAK